LNAKYAMAKDLSSIIEAAKMTHPCGILPDAKSGMVNAVKDPDAAIDRWGKPRRIHVFLFSDPDETGKVISFLSLWP
jgi:hypothetical protein